MKRTQRTLTFRQDHDGQAIALVPLANHSKPAKILQEDLEFLLVAGYSDQWTFNQAGSGYSYVRCAVSNRRGNLASVARLILNAPRGRVVTYLDDNRLNLRRDNLRLRVGNAKGVTRSARD